MQFTAFWFRRDLRLVDNAGLHYALSQGRPVVPVFIFDTQILSKLQNPKDARVDFIYQQVLRLKKELQNVGSDLLVYFGNPEECWQAILESYPIAEVVANRDYESYAIARDQKIYNLCNHFQRNFKTCKDQIIFEKDEILKEDGNPYVVFTAFKKKFLSKLRDKSNVISESKHLSDFSCNLKSLGQAFWKTKPLETLSLNDLGFESSNQEFPQRKFDETTIRNYDKYRDFPGKSGTSRLGLHLRFGTISIRQLMKTASVWNEVFLSELIWRDFYSMILQAFPYVEFSAFKQQYNNILWENNEVQFAAWCNGMTGYPMVDAGMRELNATGFMHNRLRMITASFLVKHLLVDWRWGEAYFAEKLLDFELASNNGGWQWAAGCGTDAAPYFRIFNPQLQQQRFDPEFEYIRKWVPEFQSASYPKQMVEHALARERCLLVFKNALNNSQ